MTILILKVLILAWLITSFQPLKWGLDMLKANFFTAVLQLSLTCFKCCSFYIGLIITHDIYLAALASFIAATYTISIQFIKSKLKI